MLPARLHAGARAVRRGGVRAVAPLAALARVELRLVEARGGVALDAVDESLERADTNPVVAEAGRDARRTSGELHLSSVGRANTRTVSSPRRLSSVYTGS